MQQDDCRRGQQVDQRCGHGEVSSFVGNTDIYGDNIRRLEKDVIPPREPQITERASPVAVEQCLQAALANPLDSESSCPRGVCCRLPDSVDRQMTKSVQILSAMPKDVRATYQKGVVIRRIWRRPGDRHDLLQGEAKRFISGALCSLHSRAAARLRTDDYDRRHAAPLKVARIASLA